MKKRSMKILEKNIIRTQNLSLHIKVWGQIYLTYLLTKSISI